DSATTDRGPAEKLAKKDSATTDRGPAEKLAKKDSATTDRGPPEKLAKKDSATTDRDRTNVSDTNGGGADDVSWTPSTTDPARLKAIEMFEQALQMTSSSAAAARPPRRLSAEIEAAVFADAGSDTGRYRARLRCLIQNLRDPKNPGLRASLLDGALAAPDFAVMTSEQLASAEMRQLRQRLADEAAARLKSVASASSEPGSSLFTCKRCRKKNCTYNQLQTLPGDEPMTTYVLCNECGFRWKFN
ncbi:hypothetical protein BOX15_Mlig000627g9, partial [Macrostomum lignano]